MEIVLLLFPLFGLIGLCVFCLWPKKEFCYRAFRLKQIAILKYGNIVKD